MNEVRKRHNERKIITEQYFCSKCGDRLASEYSPCGQCDSELEQSKQKHRRIHVKGENKSVLPQSSFSFSVKGFAAGIALNYTHKDPVYKEMFCKIWFDLFRKRVGSLTRVYYQIFTPKTIITFINLVIKSFIKDFDLKIELIF